MTLVAQASTGREAIECFRKQQTNVILTDIRLSDISGIELMIAIRAEFPGVSEKIASSLISRIRRRTIVDPETERFSPASILAVHHSMSLSG